MRNAEQLLQCVADLTRLQTLDELEQNLLQASSECFAPVDLFLLTIDRRGEARSLRDSKHPAPNADRRSETAMREAAQLLHEAHHQKKLSHQRMTAGEVMMAYPLIDSPPLRTGLVMVLPRDGDVDELLVTAERTILDIFRNFAELLDNAQRDELTGLLNRKTFDDNMLRVVARTSTHAPLSDDADQRAHQAASEDGESADDTHCVAIIDIDHFKSINDQFGHLVGDEVILAIANLLRECIRETDLIYRFGGEEFVIILTNVNREGASIALERLRKTLGSRSLPRAGKVTLSYGLVTVAPHVQAHHLLDRADSALYYAKSQGRNQGHFYEDLVAIGALEEAVDPTGDVELF